MKNLGLVSVIMPVFNTEKYVAEAIKSVLTKTYPFFELIVVDDGSTDSSEKVIKSFRDSRIVYLRHEKNRGVAEARNTALKIAKGRWGAVIDSDDVWLPERLENLVSVASSGKCIVSDDHYICFTVSDGLVMWERMLKLFYSLKIDKEIIEMDLVDFLNYRAPILHPIFPLDFVREKNIQEIQDFVPREDLVFYLEFLCSDFRLKIINKPYYLYRLTSGSITSRKPVENIENIEKYLLEKHKISNEGLEALKRFLKQSKEIYYYNLFAFYLKNSDFKSSLKILYEKPSLFIQFLYRLPSSIRYRIKANMLRGMVK